MVPELTKRRANIARTLCYLVVITGTSLVACGQDTEQQLQQLKEQLSTTTKQLEQIGRSALITALVKPAEFPAASCV